MPDSYVLQQLAGATLLVFANKQDLPGALSPEEIRQVILYLKNSKHPFRTRNQLSSPRYYRMPPKIT